MRSVGEVGAEHERAPVLARGEVELASIEVEVAEVVASFGLLGVERPCALPCGAGFVLPAALIEQAPEVGPRGGEALVAPECIAQQPLGECEVAVGLGAEGRLKRREC